MDQRILCLWLPNWSVQRVHAAEPLTVGRALVLEQRDARRGLQIAAANLAARRGGARVGMRMSELASLTTAPDQSAERSTEKQAEPLLWELRPYQPDEDLEALCLLAEEAQQFSPLVGLEPMESEPWCGRTSCQPQALLLDATGISHLFGGEDALLVEIAQWLRSKRYFAYMAIASTIGAAWALANYEILSRWKQSLRESPSTGTPHVNPATIPTASPTSDPVSTPTALDDVPDCRTIMAEMWEEAEILSGLPVSALRVDAETVSKLKRLGVLTLSDLWQLPRDGLASRLGTTLLKRSDQALGQAAEAIIALHGQPDWNCEFAIEHPTLDLEILKAVLAELCQQLAQRLAAKGQGALRCLCRLDLVRSRPLVMNLGLFRPSHDAHHLHGLLVGQLEQVLLRQEEGDQQSGSSFKSRGPRLSSRTTSAVGKQKPTGPLAVDDDGAVWRLNLQATLIGPIVWQQTQLFEASETEHKQQFAQLIDTLSGRLGRSNVTEARIERDAEPEQAVSYRPLTGRRTDGTEQQTLRKLNSRLASSGAEPRPTDPLRRPTQLLLPPEPLQGTSVNSDGALTEFVYENRRHQVAHHWGPERLESGWWRGPSTRRDYYRLETSCGHQWWVYRELKNDAWYLHGIFG